MIDYIGIGFSFIATFALLGYLIHRFAKGKVKKILYVVLAYFAVVMIVGLIFGENVMMKIPFVTAVIITICLLLFGGYKIYEIIARKNIGKEKPQGAISTLNGYHMGGLSANEGIKVSVCLFNDSIIFKSGKAVLDEIDKADIVRVSSFSDQEIVGAVTTGRNRTGLASTVALMSGDLAAAYFLRPKTTTYKTKNKVKNYWFFVLETATNSIVLQVKSRSALYYFVDLCNEVLNSADDADNDDMDALYNTAISIENMSGTDFEHFCADLLRVNGYTDVQITAGAGDHGIDIIAQKDDMKWGFQCKRWGAETHIGNDVVRDTFAGKAFYHCDIAAIIATTQFTRKAEEYARETGILLWGQDKLYRLMEKLDDTAQRS